ncbi:MAG TPA: hypothetical protein VL334_11280, partial [Anaerolineae bacterium]|nr:hypothetical protein [Anaerolineae bacterium]
MRQRFFRPGFLLFFALLAMLFLLPSIASAASCVSEGTENWTGGFDCDGIPDQTPTSTDTVTILSGHTITVDTGAAESGALTVEAGATLDIPAGYTLTANGDVTVDGDLSGVGAYLYFYGATLTNTGSSISVDNVYFYRTGTQTITGVGSWTGTGTLTIGYDSSTVLANDVTMTFSDYLVNGSFSL